MAIINPRRSLPVRRHWRKTRFVVHGYMTKGEENWPVDMCKVRCVYMQLCTVWMWSVCLCIYLHIYTTVYLWLVSMCTCV